jgi:effector-binding domain-containing protein
MKSAPSLLFLSTRATFPGMDDVMVVLRDVARTVPRHVGPQARERMMVIAYSDVEDEEFDLEIGFGLTREIDKRIHLPSRVELAIRELPAVEPIATIVRSGPLDQSHLAFGALGLWMEANDYRIAGPCREVFLEVPFQTSGPEDPLMEIQFPVTKAA